MKTTRIAAVAAWLVMCNLAEATEPSGKLVVFHAGSLTVPMKQICDAFTKAHPRVTILREVAGSRTCARKISDLNKRCDVMASADYTVIETLLIPAHAAWCIKFAGNEMVIAYTAGSRGAKGITSKNWFDVLLADDIAFGRSDPNHDPCGYRTVLTMKLAERHYGQAGLAKRLLGKPRQFIRPKETDLLALLETHTIDYIFLYRSVAQQHKLKFVTLPDAINLKSPRFGESYRQATVRITGKKPGVFVTKRGEPMIYGVTIPKRSPNPTTAMAFVQFMLDKSHGLAILAKNGQPPVVPSPTDTYDAIPAALKPFAAKKKDRSHAGASQ